MSTSWSVRAQRRGEVEAEAVDVHLGDPVAQRVQDHPQRVGVRGVDGVAAAGDVPVGVVVAACRSLRHPGVDAVVEAPEGQRRAVAAGLGGVVVDDVEDDLEPGGVEGAHHLLELAHLLAAVARGAVGGVRGEVADRVVAPVVDQAALADGRLGDELLHRQQLDRGHAEVAQVVGDRGVGQAGVRAAQLLGHPVVQLGHALDVQLVDDRVAPAACAAAASSPQSKSSSTTTLRGTEAAESAVLSLLGTARRRSRRSPGPGTSVAADGLGVGVEQQLGRVEAQPGRGVPRAVHPEAVAGARLARPGTAPCQMPSECSVSRCCCSPPSSSKRQTRADVAAGAQTAKLVDSSDQVAPSGWVRPGQTGAVSPNRRHSPGVTRGIVADHDTMPTTGPLTGDRTHDDQGDAPMGEFVRLEVGDGVGTIRLDRPKMNAISLQVQDELRAAAAEATERDDVKAVVIYGGERVFAAGNDVKEMAELSYADMVTRVATRCSRPSPRSPRSPSRSSPRHRLRARRRLRAGAGRRRALRGRRRACSASPRSCSASSPAPAAPSG